MRLGLIKMRRSGIWHKSHNWTKIKTVLENVMETCRPMLDKMARFNAIGMEMCEGGWFYVRSPRKWVRFKTGLTMAMAGS